MSEIYNKNAREAHLMAEAYTNVYNEEFNPRRDAPEHSERDPHPAQRAAESIIGAEVMWDGMMKSGRVDEVDVENGVAVVVDEDGGEHIVQLGDFDVVNPVEDAEGHITIGDIINQAELDLPLNDDLADALMNVMDAVRSHRHEDNEDKDFRDEQRDQDPHRHKGLSDFDAEQRDQDPHRHEDNESRAERADVDRYEYEQGKKAAYNSEAHAYRDRADKYKAKDARDSIKVGNLYKGESYHELVIGIKGDEVYTDKGNRYDIDKMLDELEYVDTIDFDFLNEIL
jgi:hypothetical protein